MAYVGGLRARLIRDSVYRALYNALDDLGWFNPSASHSPVTFPANSFPPDVEVPINTIGLVDDREFSEPIELGSILSERAWTMMVDFFGEDDALSLHLIRDVKDILEGRMPSIGRNEPIIDVYDFTDSALSPPKIFTVEIEDVRVDKAHDFPQPWMRFWRSCEFLVVDAYTDESG